MSMNPGELILQYCFNVAVWLLISAVAMKAYRFLHKPRGTYGNGLPERRRRPRLVLPDPATLQPRPVAPGTTI
jgi:hypothetical protein